MAEALATGLVNKLVKVVSDNGLIFYEKQLEKLINELQTMQSFLRHAERLRDKSCVISHIMRDLLEVIHDAEDTVADCELEKGNNLGSCDWLIHIHPSRLLFRIKIRKRLRKISVKIVEIKTYFNFCGSAE